MNQILFNIFSKLEYLDIIIYSNLEKKIKLYLIY